MRRRECLQAGWSSGFREFGRGDGDAESAAEEGEDSCSETGVVQFVALGFVVREKALVKGFEYAYLSGFGLYIAFHFVSYYSHFEKDCY